MCLEPKKLVTKKLGSLFISYLTKILDYKRKHGGCHSLLCALKPDFCKTAEHKALKYVLFDFSNYKPIASIGVLPLMKDSCCLSVGLKHYCW